MNNNYDSLIEKAIQSNGSATELRTCTVTYSAQNSTRAPETHLVGNTVNSSPACSRPFNPVYAESASWGFTTTQNACRRSATVQQLLKTDISTGLGNAVHQRAYQALIDHTFCSFSQEKRINILEQLDIDYKQMSSGASNFVVANISSDCKITALTAKHLNRCFNEAACIAGILMGMRPEYCFNTYPPKQGQEEATSNALDSSRIITSLAISDQLYIPEYHYMHDMAGDINQAICRLRAESGSIIYMVASRVTIEGKDVLAFGHKPAINWPLGRREMEYRSGSPVILCANPTTALDMRIAADEAQLQNSTGIIISGYLGDVDSLQMACFRGHPVIIVPDFTREGWLLVDKLVSQLKKACSEDIMIYPYPIKTANMTAEYFAKSAHSPWKDLFIDGCLDLTRVEIMSNVMRKVQASALSAHTFGTILEEVGLKANSASTAARQAEGELVIKRFSSLGAKPNLASIDYESDPTLWTIVKPGFILFIWGGSHSGKTFILFQIILGVISATSVLSFVCGGPPRKVLMIDGELTPDEFTARMRQLSGENPHLLNALEENIIALCVRDPEVGPIDILDSTFQTNLLAIIKTEGISVVTFDPLGRLGLHGLQGNTSKLFNFFNRLEAMGVAVIFVAHATKEGSGHKGDGGLEDFSKTVIRCEGRESLLRESDTNNVIQAALDRRGAMTTRIKIDKCKLPYKINESYEIYHIPPGGPMQYIKGNMRDTFRDPFADSSIFYSASTLQASSAAPICDQNRGTYNNLLTYDEIVPRLSEDQQRLWELFVGGVRLSRKNVETMLAWGEDKASNEIQSLKNMGRIKATGSGRSTKYVKA